MSRHLVVHVLPGSRMNLFPLGHQVDGAAVCTPQGRTNLVDPDIRRYTGYRRGGVKRCAEVRLNSRNSSWPPPSPVDPASVLTRALQSPRRFLRSQCCFSCRRPRQPGARMDGDRSTGLGTATVSCPAMSRPKSLNGGELAPAVQPSGTAAPDFTAGAGMGAASDLAGRRARSDHIGIAGSSRGVAPWNE
jgi:hypothetical protein